MNVPVPLSAGADCGCASRSLLKRVWVSSVVVKSGVDKTGTFFRSVPLFCTPGDARVGTSLNRSGNTLQATHHERYHATQRNVSQRNTTKPTSKFSVQVTSSSFRSSSWHVEQGNPYDDAVPIRRRSMVIARIGGHSEQVGGGIRGSAGHF